MEFKEEFLLLDNTDAFEKIYEQSSIYIHGVLGNNFFMKHKWILNFDQLTLYANPK